MKKYIIVIIMLLPNIGLSQNIKQDILKYLIVHNQFNAIQQDTVNYRLFEGKYFIRHLTHINIKEQRIKMYVFGSFSSHANNYLAIYLGKEKVFLNAQDFFEELKSLEIFLRNISPKDKLAILKKLLPLMLNIYERNIHDESIIVFP